MSFPILVNDKIAVEVRRFIVESEPEQVEPPIDPPVEPLEPPTEILCGDVFVHATSLVIIPFNNIKTKGALV